MKTRNQKSAPWPDSRGSSSRGTSLRTVAAAAAALLFTSAGGTSATIDGTRDLADGYTELAVQAIAAGWGNNNALASLHAVQEGSALNIHLAGRVGGNAMILFLDTKPGGLNYIPNNLITSGGEEYTINNLGLDGSSGMTFEAGFEPDVAVRIYGDGTNAYVNTYNLITGARGYAGNAGTGVITSSFIIQGSAAWVDVAPADYATHPYGMEMQLSLAGMGVPEGSGQTVEMMAILMNGGSDYGSNQVLGSRTTTGDIGGGRNTINFVTEGGIQTLSIIVDNTDNDNDGIPDGTDPDDDNDGLDDVVETDTGFYVDANDTGSDPKVADTDGDGINDGDEVLNTIPPTDPNIYNPTDVVVAGSFTTPAWQPAGIPGQSYLTRVGDGLETQFQYGLDFRFTTPQQALTYKFTNGTDWGAGNHRNWGTGGPPNSLAVNGGDINFTIVATGIHSFAVNLKNLTHSLLRKDFTGETYSVFATAYTLGADTANDDTDAWTNAQEQAANSDPTNADTDGDSLNDDVDPNPLVPEPESRDVVFKVNMNVQAALGNFDLSTDNVVVKIFSGVLAGNPDLTMTDANDDGIYETAPIAAPGLTGTNFGTFKFFNTTLGAPNSGYEEGSDRTFNLGPDGVAMVVFDPAPYFSNNSTMPTAGYEAWAGASGYNLAPKDARTDDADDDGFTNHQEFLFGTVPNVPTGGLCSVTPATGEVLLTWMQRTGSTYRLVENTDLGTVWALSPVVPVDAADQSGVPAGYVRRQATVPTSPDPTKFLRIEAEE